MKSTIALFASSRRQGNTGRLMDRVARELNLPVVDLAEKNIAEYTYDHRNRHDDFEPLMSEVLAFEQIIFASPVYWYTVCPPMKRFLDRISDYLDLPELLDDGRRFRGKTGFVLCSSITTTPADSFVDGFRETFGYLGMQYGGYLHADCANGYVPSDYEQDVASFIDLIRR